MKEKKIFTNYFFNASYQVIALIVPLITTPYISRVLHADGIGIYSFTYSIVSYFTLLAISGTATYGNKKIGILQQNAEERTKKFWDIFSYRFISSLLLLATYLLYVIFFSEYKIIAAIQSFYILGVMFDVSWFFQGMEDFKHIAVRNYIFKLINVICIFAFVRNETDLWKYVLTLAALTWLGNLSIWPYLKKYLIRLNKYVPHPFEDWKMILQLFIPTAALQIYAMLDKSMIGWITKDAAQNGYYEQAEKIVKMCLMLVTGLTAVTLPRISKAFAEKKDDEAKSYLYLSYRFVWFLGIPLMLGLAGVSNILVPVFFGDGFEYVEEILPVMSLLFIFMGLNQTSGTEFFIASGRQNIYTKCIVTGGIFNVFLNLLLIPKFGAFGACIGSVSGEGLILIQEFYYIRNNNLLSIKNILYDSRKYWIAGIFMYIVICIIKQFFDISALELSMTIIVGACCYFTILLIEKEHFVCQGIYIIKEKLKL